MRVLLTIQYLGTNYHGWQIQPGKITVQGCLEQAIQKALGEQCETFVSGRTDAGVHAWAQCAHFDTNTRIAPDKIAYILNRFLPADIRVLKSQQVSDDFNARFDVTKKTYQYQFYASDQDLPLLDATFARVRTDFCFKKARHACKYFLGTHDFQSFCSTGRQTKTTVRTIYAITLDDLGESKYRLSVTGNGFLYNMVRIIAGTLIDVGCGLIESKDIPQIIKQCDRTKAGKTAQAKGLTLKQVEYDKVKLVPNTKRI